ncbi:MAG: hypothetical protein J7K46_09935 [Bacteroidales bacterium]|nr:hypothetical protein [Bacteroidales bacterium]
MLIQNTKGLKNILRVSVLMMLLGIFFQSNVYAEGKEKSRKKLSDKVYLGGYFGLQFGTVTDVLLAPLAGYRLTPRLMIGGGFKYEYYQENTPYFKYSTHMYGPNLFTRYLFLKSFSNFLPVKFNGGLFAQAEYEALNMDHRYFGVPGQENEGRFWMNSWFLGGGYHQPIGRKSAINMLFLFYLGNREFTPYSNPVIRVEFGF